MEAGRAILLFLKLLHFPRVAVEVSCVGSAAAAGNGISGSAAAFFSCSRCLLKVSECVCGEEQGTIAMRVT